MNIGKKEKESPSCIEPIQHLLVNLCGQIINLNFSSDWSGILKNKIVADVVTYLRREDYIDELAMLSNLFKALKTLPNIFQNYFNGNMDSVIDSVNYIIAQNFLVSKGKDKETRVEVLTLIAMNSQDSNTANDGSLTNIKLNTGDSKASLTGKTLTKECSNSIVPNASPMLTGNVSKKRNQIFYEFITYHIDCVRSMIDIFKYQAEAFIKLHEIYKTITCQISGVSAFNEDVFNDLIDDLEKNSDQSAKMLQSFEDSEYLQNTFYPLLFQMNEDINMLKYLIKSYKSFLILDPIGSMSNLLMSTKSIEALKSKNQNNYDMKIYIFFVHFFIDNNYKMNMLFKTYFENKKISLFTTFSQTKFKNSTSFGSDVVIREEILQLRNNLYSDKFIQKCFDENIEMFYFVLMFEKKKYFELDSSDYKETLCKNYYLNNNLMFIDSDEDVSILSIFHVAEMGDYCKCILGDVQQMYKSYFDKVSGKDDSKTASTIISSGFSYKSKVGKNKDTLLLYKLSNYLFLAAKIKEKSSSDVQTINEICKDFRIKFAELHILKTIFDHVNK